MSAASTPGTTMTPRGRRHVPFCPPSSETTVKLQKKRVDVPHPQDPVSRKRSCSAGTRPTSAHEIRDAIAMPCRRLSSVQSRLHTADRIFPVEAPSSAHGSRRAAETSVSRKLVEWSGATQPAAFRGHQRSHSVGECSKEFSLGSLTGERRHVATPGQAAGGLFNVLSDSSTPSNRVRPMLRQKENCKVSAQGPVEKPHRLMRRCSQKGQSSGFLF